MLQPAKYEDLQLVCERRKRLGLTAMFPRHGLFALGAFILMLEGCLAMDEASPLVAVAVPALFGVAAVAVGAAELGPGGRFRDVAAHLTTEAEAGNRPRAGPAPTMPRRTPLRLRLLLLGLPQ